MKDLSPPIFDGMVGNCAMETRYSRKSELGRAVRGLNMAAKVEMTRKVDLWFKEQTSVLNRLTRKQLSAHKSLVRVCREKRRLQKEERLRREEAMAGEDERGRLEELARKVVEKFRENVRRRRRQRRREGPCGGQGIGALATSRLLKRRGSRRQDMSWWRAMGAYRRSKICADSVWLDTLATTCMAVAREELVADGRQGPGLGGKATTTLVRKSSDRTNSNDMEKESSGDRGSETRRPKSLEGRDLAAGGGNRASCEFPESATTNSGMADGASAGAREYLEKRALPPVRVRRHGLRQVAPPPKLYLQGNLRGCCPHGAEGGERGSRTPPDEREKERRAVDRDLKSKMVLPRLANGGDESPPGKRREKVARLRQIVSESDMAALKGKGTRTGSRVAARERRPHASESDLVEPGPDRMMTNVAILKKRRKKAREKVEEELRTENFTYYRRTSEGQLTELSCPPRGLFFQPPSHHEKQQQVKLLMEEREAMVEQKKKIKQFFKDVEEAGSKMAALPQPAVKNDEKVASTFVSKESLADIVFKVFRQETLATGLDPNSTEALSHCKYLRNYEPLTFEQRQAARRCKKSSWQLANESDDYGYLL